MKENKIALSALGFSLISATVSVIFFFSQNINDIADLKSKVGSPHGSQPTGIYARLEGADRITRAADQKASDALRKNESLEAIVARGEAAANRAHSDLRLAKAEIHSEFVALRNQVTQGPISKTQRDSLLDSYDFISRVRTLAEFDLVEEIAAAIRKEPEIRSAIADIAKTADSSTGRLDPTADDEPSFDLLVKWIRTTLNGRVRFPDKPGVPSNTSVSFRMEISLDGETWDTRQFDADNIEDPRFLIGDTVLVSDLKKSQVVRIQFKTILQETNYNDPWPGTFPSERSFRISELLTGGQLHFNTCIFGVERESIAHHNHLIAIEVKKHTLSHANEG